jgi:hypothetical protein
MGEWDRTLHPLPWAERANFLFLDPYYGVCVTPDAKTTAGELKYSTAVSSFGKGTATAKVTYAIFSNPT